MKDETLLLAVLNASDNRRAERRRFLKVAGGAAVAAGGLPMLAACDDDDDDISPTPTPTASPTPTPSPTPSPTPTPAITDADVLNFALNLEYLEAQFYAYAATGVGLPNAQLGGTGTQGEVIGGRQVSFSDRVVAQYAREIAGDEAAHVAFLRTALGSAAVAQPRINIGGGADGAFTAAARAAGVIGDGQTFDPYASDLNFLLGAFIFEDVGVTAYQGAAPLLTNPAYIEASAGILSAEAYHAGLLRTALFARGVEARSPANKISAARDLLDGPDDLDQPLVLRPDPTPNLVPADANAIVFGRSAGQVLNIVYLNGAAVVGGGFFPDGVNGAINTSAASVAA
jgi:hypothetical protein